MTEPPGPLDLIGATVQAHTGERIGEVDAVFVDDASEAPRFVLVDIGPLRARLVPLEGAELIDGQLRVPYTKGKVSGAPTPDDDQHLEPDEERELFRYYDLEGWGTGINEDAEQTAEGTTTDRSSHRVTGEDDGGGRRSKLRRFRGSDD